MHLYKLTAGLIVAYTSVNAAPVTPATLAAPLNPAPIPFGLPGLAGLTPALPIPGPGIFSLLPVLGNPLRRPGVVAPSSTPSPKPANPGNANPAAPAPVAPAPAAPAPAAPAPAAPAPAAPAPASPSAAAPSAAAPSAAAPSVAAPPPSALSAAVPPPSAPSIAVPAPANSSTATPPTAPNTANPNNANPAAQIQACAADVDRLASGIQQNILDQQGEQVIAKGLLLFLQARANGTRTINGTIPRANSTLPRNGTRPLVGLDRNLGLFLGLKSQLLAFVNAGVAIRAGNQAIAPPGSPAAQGLAQVANAQRTELALASSLTGDPAVDIPTVQKLLADFAAGAKQNMQNLLDATQNCTPTDLIAQRGIQIALRSGLKTVVPAPAADPAPSADPASGSDSAGTDATPSGPVAGLRRLRMRMIRSI